MDLKLGFCVFYLNLLILLVTDGTEARKMIEENMQGEKLNFPLAQIHATSYESLKSKDVNQNLRINNNQGDNNHQQAKTRLNFPLAQNIWINNQGDNNHQQAKKSLNFLLAQIHATSYGSLLSKDATQNFWRFNNQGDTNQLQDKIRLNFPLAQIHATSYGNLQSEDDTQNLWINNNQGDNTHQQTKTRLNPLAQIHATSYGSLQSKDASQNIWINKNQGDNNHLQEKSRLNLLAQIHTTSYGSLQSKDANQNIWIDKNQGDNNHQQVQKILNPLAQIHATSYESLQSTDSTQNFWIDNNQGENNNNQAKTKNTHIHSSSHIDHIDPSLRVFCLMNDLKLRKQIIVSFPRRDLSSSPSFISKEEADLIPFSLKKLPNILQRFSISQNSLQARVMEDILSVCEVPPRKGETKYCATSVEAMLDFVQETMGEKIQIQALSTIHFSNSTPLLQKYTILDAPQEVATHKMVACHTMPYAYTVFYCHCTISKSKVFKVSLGGENGDRVEAIAVCHLDTSEWSPSQVSFRVLGILPGTSPICHFFPSDNLVWISKIIIADK